MIVSSKKNKIHVIDPITGKTLFKKNITNETPYISKITNNNIYLNVYGNNIIKFNVKDKEKIFQYSSMSPSININSGTNIINSNGIIYNIYSNGKLISINKKNNKIIWNKIIYKNTENTEYKKISTTINDVKINNKIIYTVNYNGQFVAINTNNKNILWTKNFNEPIKFLIKKKYILVTTKSGKIYEINKTNGNIIWNKNLNTKKLTTPINIKNIKSIIIFDKYGNIYSINKSKVIKKYKTKIGFIEKDPIKNSKENIYIITKNGNLLYMKFIK